MSLGSPILCNALYSFVMRRACREFRAISKVAALKVPCARRHRAKTKRDHA